uniref:Secreted protein n=1 Tax=Parascaris univalens TaxID=6257 RepID=A0A915A5T5_PARUN
MCAFVSACAQVRLTTLGHGHDCCRKNPVSLVALIISETRLLLWRLILQNKLQNLPRSYKFSRASRMPVFKLVSFSSGEC